MCFLYLFHYYIVFIFHLFFYFVLFFIFNGRFSVFNIWLQRQSRNIHIILCNISWNCQTIKQNILSLLLIFISDPQSGWTSYYPPYVKLRLSSSSVLLGPNQEDSSNGVRPSWLLLAQSWSWSWSYSLSRSVYWSWSWFWFWFCPVPNMPLKTFSSSHDWQLSVTLLSRWAKELRGLRLRRKTLWEYKKTNIKTILTLGSVTLDVFCVLTGFPCFWMSAAF